MPSDIANIHSAQKFLLSIDHLHEKIAVKLTDYGPYFRHYTCFNGWRPYMLVNEDIRHALSSVRSQPYFQEHGDDDFKKLLKKMDDLMLSWGSKGGEDKVARQELERMDEEVVFFIRRIEIRLARLIAAFKIKRWWKSLRRTKKGE